MMEDPIEITFPVIRVQQPIGEFFIGSVRARDLFKICYFDIRKIHKEDGIETYLGVQREISDARVAEIKQYVRTRDATFPTGVIIAVDQRCAELKALQGTSVEDTQTTSEELSPEAGAFEQSDEAAGAPENPLDHARFSMLTLRNLPDPRDGGAPVLFKQIARVLDGQHRIAGLEGYAGDDFEVNVAVFVGLDPSLQAGIFSVVNLAQTKVNRSLVYDLYEYDKARFPEKTCHEIAVALDRAETSPFKGMIKRLGVSEKGRFGQTLSQATFVEGLLPYLSENIIPDRDIGRRGMPWPEPTAEQLNRMIFRGMFIEGRDVDIATNLRAYFGAVKDKWEDAWEWKGAGRVLNKTTGFNALMRFLKPAYLHFTQPGGVVSKEQFAQLLEPVTIRSDEFDTETFKPGSSGASKLYARLMEESRLA